MKKLRGLITLLSILTIILAISSNSYAEEVVPTSIDASQVAEAINGSVKDASSQYHEGDLYESAGEVVVNQSIDGNAYISGKHVKIDSEIRGNLFVIAESVEVTEKATISTNAYIAAKDVVFNAQVPYLYVASKDLSMGSKSGIMKDLYVAADKATILGQVGRSANIAANTIILQSGDEKAKINQNLNYFSQTELKLEDGIVGNKVNFTQEKAKTYKGSSTLNILMNFINAIIATSFIYLMYRFFMNKGLEKSSSCLTNKFGKVFLTGLGALIATPILSLILILSNIGINLGIILLIMYVFMLAIAPYIFASILARRICQNKEYTKVSIEYLVAIAISVVVCALTLIPVVGVFVSAFISILGLGIILNNMFFGNNCEAGNCHKESKINKSEKANGEALKSAKADDVVKSKKAEAQEKPRNVAKRSNPKHNTEHLEEMSKKIRENKTKQDSLKGKSQNKK